MKDRKTGTEYILGIGGYRRLEAKVRSDSNMWIGENDTIKNTKASSDMQQAIADKYYKKLRGIKEHLNDRFIEQVENNELSKEDIVSRLKVIRGML